MANSEDPDETPRSAASHLGLQCLPRPVCPNTYDKVMSSDVEKSTLFSKGGNFANLKY